MTNNNIDDVLINLAVDVQKVAQTQTDKDGNYYITIEQLHNIISNYQTKEKLND